MEAEGQTSRMRDFKYRDLATAELRDWGWHLKDFRSESLRPIAERFLFNNIRSTTFATMPAWIAFEALREQLWFDHATVKCGGTLDPDLTQYHSSKITPEIEAEFNRLVFEHREIDKEKFRQLLREIGITYFEYQLAGEGKATASNIDALFCAIILDSWTAFEYLVSDLWTVTMNAEDGTLASRLESSGELAKPNKTPETIKHNIKTSYGSYCVETRRVSFQKLENIKRLYAATFGKETRNLFDKIGDGYIHALHAFRNVFLHRAGEADEKFMEDVQRFPEFRGISVGDKLLPDGEQVKKMRDASVLLGRQLIQVADSVLSPP